MEKLTQLALSGVALTIYGGQYWNYSYPLWHIKAQRKSLDATLEMDARGDDLAEVAEELFTKWVRATSGLPELSIQQIEHQPPTRPLIDDEIPF